MQEGVLPWHSTAAICHKQDKIAAIEAAITLFSAFNRLDIDLEKYNTAKTIFDTSPAINNQNWNDGETKKLIDDLLLYADCVKARIDNGVAPVSDIAMDGEKTRAILF